MKDLNELKNQYKKLGEEIEKLKKGNSGRWKPEKDEMYWYIDDVGDIDDCYWDNDKCDNWRYINHNVLKTEEEAQEYHDYILSRADYIYEFTIEEWVDINIIKYCIYCNYYDNELQINCVSYGNCCSYASKLYFKTKEKAQEFIDKYKKQILKYEFGIEED